MASVMRAWTSAYESDMLWWSYGGLNLVGIGIFTSVHRGVVFIGLTNTPPGDGVWSTGMRLKRIDIAAVAQHIQS